MSTPIRVCSTGYLVSGVIGAGFFLLLAGGAMKAEMTQEVRLAAIGGCALVALGSLLYGLKRCFMP